MSADEFSYAVSPGPDCLPAERLALTNWTVAEQTHFNSCGHCQAELHLLNQFESGAARPDERATLQWISRRLKERRSEITDVGRRKFAGRKSAATVRNLMAVAFAGLLLALAIAVQQRQAPVPGVAFYAPGGDFRNSPAELAWRPVPHASGYRIKVKLAGGAILWQTETVGTTARMPPDIQARARLYGPIEWEVTAVQGPSSIAIGRARFQLN